MHACMHVYVLKVPYNKEKFLTSILCITCACMYAWVCITCVCLKVPYIRRNSLQINYGVQFYCVSHVGVHHMCMPESSLYIRRNSLQIKYSAQFIVYHMWVHVHHMCMPESSLHKEKFLTNKV